jgi:oxepin-CoA hydrolase/3-oxo-5,6-dehydrosuberyl-CoA semialdehyde dehydrogenase
MNKIQHYVQGNWTTGKEEGTPVYDAITGDIISNIAIEGLDIPEVLQYGRTKGGEVIRKMTFQERGNMLKKLAF